MAPEEKSFIGPNAAQEGGSQPTLLGQPEWLACFCSQRKDICTSYSRPHMQMKLCVPIFNNSDSNPLGRSSGEGLVTGVSTWLDPTAEHFEVTTYNRIPQNFPVSL